MIKSNPHILNSNNNNDNISIKENKESELSMKKGDEVKLEESENLESQQSEVLGYNLKNAIMSENTIKKPNSEKVKKKNNNKQYIIKFFVIIFLNYFILCFIFNFKKGIVENKKEVEMLKEVRPLEALETFKPNRESVRSHLSADVIDDVSLNLSGILNYK